MKGVWVIGEKLKKIPKIEAQLFVAKLHLALLRQAYKGEYFFKVVFSFLLKSIYFVLVIIIKMIEWIDMIKVQTTLNLFTDDNSYTHL